MWRSVIAGAVLAPWVVWALVRGSGAELPYPVPALLAFTPEFAVGLLVALIVIALLRAWRVLLVGLALAALFAWWIVPRGVGEPEPVAAGAPTVTVMSMNTLAGSADAWQVLNVAVRERVDVLALQELRSDWLRQFLVAGGDRRFAHRVATGPDVGLLSRWSLSPTGNPAEADVRLPRIGPTRIRSVHPKPPLNGPRTQSWRAALAALPARDPDQPRQMLIGDFNATLDHAELRNILAGGYRDAADVVGAGLEKTWSARRPFFPELTIDHVLVGPAWRVQSFRVIPIRGTDHRAIIAVLAARPSQPLA